MICFFHRIWKRQAMVCIILHSMVSILWSQSGETQIESTLEEDVGLSTVYEVEIANNREDLRYSGLFRMIIRLENDFGISINPQNFPVIAINFDTRIAPGLHTQIELLSTMAKILELRGFEKENLFFVTYRLETSLIKDFENGLQGYRIITSKSENYYHPEWFHESPMPSSIGDLAELLIKYPNDFETRKEMERKSNLPACLFLGDTYWINLATAKDDYYIGIDGAVTNATLNACGNTQRFRKDNTMGPAAASEILAIPELWDKHLFSLIDLSEIQIAGGPTFNSEFVRHQSFLLLSKNPVFLDYHAMHRICKLRRMAGLLDKNPDNFKLFTYAKELGLGDVSESRILKLPD